MSAAQKYVATTSRDFRSFLLVAQFEAAQIGARIKQARNEAGMTQDDLAALTSFGKRSLQDYENGVTFPYRHLQEIGTVLDRPVAWFLHGEKEPEVPPIEQLREIVREELQGVLAALARIEHAGGAHPGAEEEQSG